MGTGILALASWKDPGTGNTHGLSNNEVSRIGIAVGGKSSLCEMDRRRRVASITTLLPLHDLSWIYRAVNPMIETGLSHQFFLVF